MQRNKLKILTFVVGALLGLVSLAHATANYITLNSNLADIFGSPVTSNTYMTFTLQNSSTQIPHVPAGSLIVPSGPQFPDNTGLVSVQLTDNNSIVPLGTFYRICIYRSGLLYRCDNYIITGDSPQDISTLMRLNPSPNPQPPLTSVQPNQGGTGSKTFPPTHAVAVAEGQQPYNFIPTLGTNYCFLGSLGSDPFWGPCPGGGGGITWPSAVVDQGGQLYNVKAYGALGNGSHDDTSAINTTIALCNANGGTVFFPVGQYLISATPTTITNRACNLMGAGRASTIQAASGTTGIALWKLNTPTFDTPQHNQFVRDISFNCNASNPSVGSGRQNNALWLLDAPMVKTLNVNASNCDSGVLMEISSIWDERDTFTDVTVENSTAAFTLQHDNIDAEVSFDHDAFTNIYYNTVNSGDSFFHLTGGAQCGNCSFVNISGNMEVASGTSSVFLLDGGAAITGSTMSILAEIGPTTGGTNYLFYGNTAGSAPLACPTTNNCVEFSQGFVQGRTLTAGLTTYGGSAWSTQDFVSFTDPANFLPTPNYGGTAITLDNPNFLDGMFGWSWSTAVTAVQDTSSPFTSGKSAKITTSTQNEQIISNRRWSAYPGENISASAYLKSDGTFSTQMAVVAFDGLNNVLGFPVVVGPTTSTSWAQYTASGTTPANTVSLGVIVTRNDAGGGSHSGWATALSITNQPPLSNLVFTNSGNTYTTGVQDMSAATDFYVPTGAGATTSHNGSIKFDSTNLGLHAYINAVDHLIAAFVPGLNPANNDCVKWVVAGGSTVPELGTAGAPCGSGSGSGTAVTVNGGSTLTNLNINATTPAATSGFLNVTPNITGANLSNAIPWPTAGAYCYAKFGGNDANDGLSLATAKRDIMGCYDALPATGGSIFFMDGGSGANPVQTCTTTDPSGCGIWIMKAGGAAQDVNFAAVSPGLTLSAAALHSGSNTTYTGTITDFATLVPGMPIAISGFGTSANNGTFTLVSAPNNSTIIVANGAGQAETHAGLAKLAGWRVAKATVSFYGLGGSCNGPQSQGAQTCIAGGNNNDAIHPVIWLSNVFSHHFENISAGFPWTFAYVGVGSDRSYTITSSSNPASWNNSFNNVFFRAAAANNGGGPALVIGTNSNWNTFSNDQFSSNTFESPKLSGCVRSSGVSTCTINSSTWPANWVTAGTLELWMSGTNDLTFSGYIPIATIASTTTFTYPNPGPDTTTTNGYATSLAGWGAVINPNGLSSAGAGFNDFRNTFTSGGGILDKGGSQGNSLTDYVQWSENATMPPFESLGCNQIASEQQVQVNTIYVADQLASPAGNPLPGARYSGSGLALCSRGHNVTNATTSGPWNLNGGAGPALATRLPSVAGSTGVYAGKVFAQQDTSRRNFAPAVLPDGAAPLVLRDKSLWGTLITGCGTPSIVGTNYTAPDGQGTAAASVSPVSGTLNYACMYAQSTTLNVGDVVMIGTWAKSLNANGYQNGTTIQAVCLACTWTKTGTHQVNATPTIGGGGEWQWTWAWDKVSVGAVDTLAIQGYSSPTNTVAFYGTTAILIPAAAGYSDNELAEIASNLVSYRSDAQAGDVFTLPGQRFFTDTIKAQNINGILHATQTDANFTQDDTAYLQSLLDACPNPGCTIRIPPGQYKITAPLTHTGIGLHIEASGNAGGGPGTGGPQLGTVTLGGFTANQPILILGSGSAANYKSGSINGVTFICKAGSNACAGGVLAINQSYFEFNNDGFSGFSQAATAAPTTPSLTPSTTGGTLAAATYYVAITDVDIYGRETLNSTPTSVVVGGSGAGSVLVASHSVTSPMTKWNVYFGASPTTLHLIKQGQTSATTYTIVATDTSGVAPPVFDHSAAYGLNMYGSSGNLGTLSGGYSNQNIVRNVQVYNGTLNGLVFDRNTSGTKVESGNINLASNTAGYGLIAGGTSDIVIHTEAGGTGSTRAGITGATGRIKLDMDLGSGTQTGVQMVNAFRWSMVNVSCGAGGTQTAINADSASGGNWLIATDNGTCANPLIQDSASFQAYKYDAEAAMTYLRGPVTLSSPLLPGSGGTGVSNPTAHQVPIAEGSSAFTFITPGTSGLCLISNGTSADPSFQACPSGFSNPMTTIGDMIGATTAGAAARIVGGKTGQTIVATNAATPAFGPLGIAKGNGGSDVTGAAYLIQCDSSTAQIDRGTEVVFASGASAPVLPDPSDTGCGAGFAFRIANKNAGSITFSRETAATFDVYGFAKPRTSVTSFTMDSGQTATVFADSTSHYYVHVTPLSALGNLGAVTWNAGGTCALDALGNGFGFATLTTVSSQTCTLSPSNLILGGSYTLKITNAASAAGTLTLGTGGACSAWLVQNGGAGAITLSGSSKIDVLAFTFDGTNCVATFGTNFN